MSSLNRMKSLKANTGAIWETYHCEHSEHLVSDLLSTFCYWKFLCCIFTWFRAGWKALWPHLGQRRLSQMCLWIMNSWLAFFWTKSTHVKKPSFYYAQGSFTGSILSILMPQLFSQQMGRPKDFMGVTKWCFLPWECQVRGNEDFQWGWASDQLYHKTVSSLFYCGCGLL